MLRVLVTIIVTVVFSVSARAEEYTYQAQVEGMVCSFCAYNVGKTLGTLPGVVAESVSVNLESGLVDFDSTALVDQTKVSAAISESGFTLVKLYINENPRTQSTSFSNSPAVALHLDGVNAAQFEPILKALGELASNEHMRLVIEAPEAVEIDLLMPILMGRKPAINVQFVAIESNSMELKMFAASNAN